ncbi:MAG: porin, partial [Proteobacteria bacterium]|nr:porin [Pseudomonadota bacterium]
MPKITTKGKIKITSADGNWSFQPIGRVMWDAVHTDADNGNSSDDVKGTELRRARLGFQGSIYNWGYKFEADFAGGDASIKDAYVSYGTKFGDTKFGLKLGQSHIPFGLNTKVSSKYMTFMDRPMFADNSVSPARASGAVVSLAAKDYRWSLAAGLQNGAFDGDNDTYEVNGSTFAVRGSFLPYMEDK